VFGFEKMCLGHALALQVPIAFAHVLPETLRLYLIYRLAI
jgi:hypothetical protein